MNEIAVYIMLAITFAALLVWLMRTSRNSAEIRRLPNLPIDRTLENVLPKHYRFFPQVRQALSAGDVQYLRDSAPPRVAQKALRQRRAVAKLFLSGLREDFSTLERLARMVAALSPVISREQETERLMLSLRFRLLYSLVWLRLSAGGVPLKQIEYLTELIGQLALRMEQAMAAVNALTAERLSQGLSA